MPSNNRKSLHAQGGKHTSNNLENPVTYPDGSSLARPLSIPRNRVIIVVCLIVIGVVIGAILLYNALDTVLGASAREEAALEENLTRDVSYDVPSLTELSWLDDEDMQQTFVDEGFTTFVTSDPEDYPEGGFELVKLPSDVSLEEGQEMYDRGIENLSAPDAALLLKGAWFLDVDRSESLSIHVSYADFSSATIENAIDSAITAQDFNIDEASVAEDDSMGNIYREGTVEVGETTYTWRVSACPLTDVYSISGLPDTSFYVGIRLIDY